MAVVKTMFQGDNRLVINVTEDFTTADETDVVIIDRSTLTGPAGGLPKKIRINEITWAVFGFDDVVLEWDDATDEIIERLNGQGFMDYRPFGGKSPAAVPNAAADGDIILTTNGGAAGDNYSIMIDCTLKGVSSV